VPLPGVSREGHLFLNAVDIFTATTVDFCTTTIAGRPFVFTYERAGLPSTWLNGK